MLIDFLVTETFIWGVLGIISIVMSRIYANQEQKIIDKGMVTTEDAEHIKLLKSYQEPYMYRRVTWVSGILMILFALLNFEEMLRVIFQ